MRAGLIFTGTGPIVILTSHDSLTDPDLVRMLAEKGIRKFLAFEVPVETVRARYRAHYDMVMDDLRQKDDLRVVDEDGHHVYAEFSLRELGPPIVHDP